MKRTVFPLRVFVGETLTLTGAGTMTSALASDEAYRRRNTRDGPRGTGTTKVPDPSVRTVVSGA